MTMDKAYDLESVKIPSLIGGQLKFFAGALENSALIVIIVIRKGVLICIGSRGSTV